MLAKFLVLVASLLSVGAFMTPAAKFGSSSLQMSADKISAPKLISAALIASSMIGSMPAFAVEGMLSYNAGSICTYNALLFF
jgi:hypothetical protein